MKKENVLTNKCKYWEICKFSDTIQCPNIMIGCFLMLDNNKAEAEKL